MLETTTRLEHLTRTLWDSSAHRSISNLGFSVPFSTRSVVGARYDPLSSIGKESIVNINQKPFETKLTLDWTAKRFRKWARVTDTGTH